MKEIGVFRRLVIADKSQISSKDSTGSYPCDLLWELYLQRHALYENNACIVHKPAPQILRILFLILEDHVESDNLQDVIHFQSTHEWLRAVDFVRLYQEACCEEAAGAA